MGGIYGTPHHCNAPPPYQYEDDSYCPNCCDEYYCEDHQDPDADRAPLDRVHEIADWIAAISRRTPDHDFRPLLTDLRDAVDEYNRTDTPPIPHKTMPNTVLQDFVQSIAEHDTCTCTERSMLDCTYCRAVEIIEALK